MKIIIIACLLVIFFLLLQDKIIIKWKLKKEPFKEKVNPKLPDVMGQPKPLNTPLPLNAIDSNQTNENIEVNPDDLDIAYDKNETLYRQIPNEELDKAFNTIPDLEEEEEEWRQEQLSEKNSGFASGVSFEELNTASTLLQKDHLDPYQKQKTVDIVQRLQGTELFSLLENSIEDSTNKIVNLLNSAVFSETNNLNSNKKNNLNEFDINKFI